MQHYNIKRKEALLLILFSLIVFLVTFSYRSLVVTASETLPSGVVIGDETGISANSEGEFFVDLPNIKPSVKYEKTITIRSLDISEPFELGLLVTEKSSKGILDFNEHILLTLTLDGKELYKGNLLGNGKFDWSKQPLTIGTCKYGKDQILVATFEVDKDLTKDDFREESELLYYWTFVATKKNEPNSTKSTASPTSDNELSKGKLPMTGEEIKNLIYQILTGLLLILIVILLWKKKKDEDA